MNLTSLGNKAEFDHVHFFFTFALPPFCFQEEDGVGNAFS